MVAVVLLYVIEEFPCAIAIMVVCWTLAVVIVIVCALLHGCHNYFAIANLWLLVAIAMAMESLSLMSLVVMVLAMVHSCDAWL